MKPCPQCGKPAYRRRGLYNERAYRCGHCNNAWDETASPPPPWIAAAAAELASLSTRRFTADEATAVLTRHFNK